MPHLKMILSLLILSISLQFCSSSNSKNIKIYSGGSHSCALLNSDQVKCWGQNDYGQLGLGDTDNRGDDANEMGNDLPTVNLGSGRTAKSLAIGSAHSCAILDNDQVKCWGQNDYGQLGLGDTDTRGDDANEMGNDLPAVDLGSGRSAQSLAVGSTHSCAILDNDQVKCWGWNIYGQLGLGYTDNRGDDANEMGNDLPTVNLGSGRTAKSLALGDFHSCALLDNGQVKCWGWNTFGQLGLGDTDNRGDDTNEMGNNLPAVDLGSGRSAQSLAVGSTHSCAILDNDQVKCWGWNIYGQLGLGYTDNRGDDANEMGNDLPTVNLGSGRTAKSLAAGYAHICALLDNDQVKCWGFNGSSQLGLGDSDNRGNDANEMGNNLSVVNLGSGRTAKSLAVGTYHSCALLDNDQVKCWGWNDSGQLGLGDSDNRGDDNNEMGDDLPAIEIF